MKHYRVKVKGGNPRSIQSDAAAIKSDGSLAFFDCDLDGRPVLFVAFAAGQWEHVYRDVEAERPEATNA